MFSVFKNTENENKIFTWLSFPNIKRKSIENSIICMKLFHHLPHTENDIQRMKECFAVDIGKKHSNDQTSESKIFSFVAEIENSEL